MLGKREHNLTQQGTSDTTSANTSSRSVFPVLDLLCFSPHREPWRGGIRRRKTMASQELVKIEQWHRDIDTTYNELVMLWHKRHLPRSAAHLLDKSETVGVATYAS